ncbi:hypothetical protein ACFWNK_03085 [Streptomyces sp. NPDC058417]|uniref:effector-associated constant component EACC1 n=1 Tax=unclassified Streptomyces TaxID=2593676 RepID=UPI003648E59C
MCVELRAFGGADVRVWIEGAGPGGESDDGGIAELTASFADWLVQDRDVNRDMEIRRARRTVDDGGMSGGPVEWIDLVLSSGFSTAALVYSHRAFRASLPPRLRPSVRLVVEHGDSRIVIEDGTPEDAARTARALAAADSTNTVRPVSPSQTEGTSPEGGAGADS